MRKYSRLYFMSIMSFLFLSSCMPKINENVESWDRRSLSVDRYYIDYRFPSGGTRRIKDFEKYNVGDKYVFIENIDYGGSGFDSGDIIFTLSVHRFNEQYRVNEVGGDIDIQKFSLYLSKFMKDQMTEVLYSGVKKISGVEWLFQEKKEAGRYWLYFGKPLDQNLYLNMNVTFIKEEAKMTSNVRSLLNAVAENIVSTLVISE